MSDIYYINLTGFFREKNVSIRDYSKLFIICDLVLDGKEVKLIEQGESGFTCVNSKLVADFYFKRLIDNKSIYRKKTPVEYRNEDNKIFISFADDNDIYEFCDIAFDDYIVFTLTAEDEEKISLQQGIKLYSVIDDLSDGKYIEKYDLKHFPTKSDCSQRIDAGIKRVSETMKYDLYVIDGNGNDDEIEPIRQSCKQNEKDIKICVVLMEGGHLETLYKQICELKIPNIMLFRKVDLYSLNRLIQQSNKCFFTQKYECIAKYICSKEEE